MKVWENKSLKDITRDGVTYPAPRPDSDFEDDIDEYARAERAEAEQYSHQINNPNR